MNAINYAKSIATAPSPLLVALAKIANYKIQDNQDPDGTAKIQLAMLEVEAETRGWSLREHLK